MTSISVISPLLSILTTATLVFSGPAAPAQAPCELDWNRDGVVDPLDVADAARFRGFYYEWYTLVVAPHLYSAIFPDGDPYAVDWNDDGNIDLDDILGLNPVGYWYQYLAYTDPRLKPRYRQLFPASNCGRSTLGNILERDLVGAKSVLVLPLAFPRGSLSAITSQAGALSHGQAVAQLLSDQSAGQLDLAPTATPVLDMPQHPSYYYPGGQFDMARLRADIAALALQRGYDLARYDYGLVLLPKFWGQAWAGFANQWQLAFNSTLNVPLSMHELGHTFGWLHADLLSCPGGSPLCSSGYQQSKNDHFDVMGYNNPVIGRFGPWKQKRAGWLDDRSAPRVTRSGTYTLRSLGIPPTRLGAEQYIALELRINELDSYWVYFRGDEPLADDGVLISRTTHDYRGTSVLHDMTPGSSAGWQDAELSLGRTFNDWSAGISVRVLAVNANSVDVQVDVPSSIAAIPDPLAIGIVSPTRQDTVAGWWTFEATAYDPKAGVQNGDGIQKVTLRLNGSVMVAWQDQFQPPFRMTVNTNVPNIPDGHYRLFVEATAFDGRKTQTYSHVFINNNGPSF